MAKHENQYPVLIRELGISRYANIWSAMKEFTTARGSETPDEFWVTEHFPVYTVGLNGRNICPPTRQDIPLVATDRGGNITYHGPGQLVLYLLLDLSRLNIGVKELTNQIECSVLDVLSGFHIQGELLPDAPGVYVNREKIASLGLRLRNGFCYHGISLNVDMDLSPFCDIDPCGYKGLVMTQLKSLGVDASMAEIAHLLVSNVSSRIYAGQGGANEHLYAA
jgi:lipoyl(octanoyl) transferase